MQDPFNLVLSYHEPIHASIKHNTAQLRELVASKGLSVTNWKSFANVDAKKLFPYNRTCVPYRTE
jgi:hypothetical protein